MAMIQRQDRQEWYHDGKLHREDGPAVQWDSGATEWWLHGRLHRDDGPAVEWADGTRIYYQHGIMKSMAPKNTNGG